MKRFSFLFTCTVMLTYSGFADAKTRHTIVVNKWNNTLNYYETGKAKRQFRVATGLYKCTPEGSFRIIQKSFISRSGRGQFGTRWLGLNTLGKRGWYRIGIHGTNEPESIGKYASKACVRMHNADINWLFERVPYGTTVRIVDVPIKPKPVAAKPAQLPFTMSWLRRPQQPRSPLFSVNDRRFTNKTQVLPSQLFAPLSPAASTPGPAFSASDHRQPLFLALNRKSTMLPVSYTNLHTKLWR